MDIEITVYKESGKYYTSDIIKSEIDIPMWKDEFRKFIRDNNPADLGDGFIATRDANDTQTFHNALWRYGEIY